VGASAARPHTDSRLEDASRYLTKIEPGAVEEALNLDGDVFAASLPPPKTGEAATNAS
jgi:hypothetical protein